MSASSETDESNDSPVVVCVHEGGLSNTHAAFYRPFIFAILVLISFTAIYVCDRVYVRTPAPQTSRTVCFSLLFFRPLDLLKYNLQKFSK